MVVWLVHPVIHTGNSSSQRLELRFPELTHREFLKSTPGIAIPRVDTQLPMLCSPVSTPGIQTSTCVIAISLDWFGAPLRLSPGPEGAFLPGPEWFAFAPVQSQGGAAPGPSAFFEKCAGSVSAVVLLHSHYISDTHFFALSPANHVMRTVGHASVETSVVALSELNAGSLISERLIFVFAICLDASRLSSHISFSKSVCNGRIRKCLGPRCCADHQGVLGRANLSRCYFCIAHF